MTRAAGGLFGHQPLFEPKFRSDGHPFARDSQKWFFAASVAVSYLAVPFDCAQDMLCGFAALRDFFVPPYAQRVAGQELYAVLMR